MAEHDVVYMKYIRFKVYANGVQIYRISEKEYQEERARKKKG